MYQPPGERDVYEYFHPGKWIANMYEKYEAICGRTPCCDVTEVSKTTQEFIKSLDTTVLFLLLTSIFKTILRPTECAFTACPHGAPPMDPPL